MLLLAETPGRHADWLVCMISSRIEQAVPGFDEVIGAQDADFEASGLTVASVVRVARLAVVSADSLPGKIGSIDAGRLDRVRQRIADWISRGV